jgi:hypothetical protein
MKRLACLTLLGLAACTSSSPSLETVRFADLPAPRITFGRFSNGMLADSMFLEIGYDEQALEGCARLPASFRATIGGTQMRVTHNGAISDPEIFECRYPTLQLDVPPPAESMVLEDESKQLVIDVGPWLVRFVPGSPLVAEVGQTVKVPYAPATALPYSSASLALEYPGGQQAVPFEASAGELTFVAPDRVGTGTLALLIPGGGAPRPWPCTGATCRVVGAWELEAAIEIRAPAP